MIRSKHTSHIAISATDDSVPAIFASLIGLLVVSVSGSIAVIWMACAALGDGKFGPPHLKVFYADLRPLGRLLATLLVILASTLAWLVWDTDQRLRAGWAPRCMANGSTCVARAVYPQIFDSKSAHALARKTVAPGNYILGISESNQYILTPWATCIRCGVSMYHYRARMYRRDGYGEQLPVCESCAGNWFPKPHPAHCTIKPALSAVRRAAH